ncbi:imidazolonepropionase [Haloarcula amylovorans]|uniref:imidazolonepropionase n=1 Tax=Haloarcula amylovorans TaxID=2562280 RepID=UPI0010762CF7|nr:imidazolonepropionase [Halomicroarcula amylolytica]
MTDLNAVVHGANELVVGPEESGRELETVEDGAVAVVDGEVAAVGPTDEITREYPPANAHRAIDAGGQAVLPGFVDPHTHGLFAGDRSDEFAAKLRGKSYQDILSEGGGILRTVRAVREADDEMLLSNLLGHLDTMLENGTTTVEVKSGYGLDTKTELRMLNVIDRADDRHPVDVVPTFMGAHAVPEGRDADDYADEVVEEQIPAVESQGVAEFCDVFCEEGVFSVSQSRRVLEAGEAAGMTPKVHAEELAHIGGTQLAAELGAASADHLLHATDDDIESLVESGVTPVLLPGTAFGLGAEYADAEAFLEADAPVAVATDFNPNCHSHSMGFAMALSCVEMRMTPAEAVVAGTHNAALALDREDGRGTLREGAPGDVLVLDALTHVHVPYQYGTNVVETVLADGNVVCEGGRTTYQ